MRPAYSRPPFAGSQTRLLAGSHHFALTAKKARFRGLILAGAAGFEPATFGFGDRRSTS